MNGVYLLAGDGIDQASGLRSDRGTDEYVRPIQNDEKRLKQNSFPSHLSI